MVTSALETSRTTTAHSFETFFEAITGHSAYAWQRKAAAALLAGDLLGTIAAPTGMGKTSLLLAWAWALAQDVKRCADGAERRVPLRYTAVIDRRVVVDATADAAKKLARELEAALTDENSHPAVVDVAQTLRRLSGRPIDVRVLRGGLEARPEGPRNPAAATVVVGTIDLVGSRLLWRGYGVSPRRRPIDAAMVGVDSLFVLDEAHLAAQFETTLSVLDRHVRHSPQLRVPGRQLVVMTATPREHGEEFDWAEEIRRNPALEERRRNRRGMPVEIVDAPKTADAFLVGWAKSATPTGQCVLVFFNTAKAARDAAAALHGRKDLGEREIVLLVGGMPDRARNRALELLTPYLSSNEDRATARPVIICATQTLEVGADVDADSLVTAVSSVASLVQRLGRVNRVGARAAGSVTLVAGVGKDPVYPAAPQLAAKLRSTALVTVGDLEDLLAAEGPAEDVLTAVMPRHIFENYVRTEGSPNEPEVARWLRSPQDERVQLQVAFRESVSLLSDAALIAHLDRWPPRPDEIWTIAGDGADLLWPPKSTRRAVLMDSSGASPTRVIEGKPGQFRPGDVFVVAPSEDAKTSLPFWGIDLICEDAEAERPFVLERVPEDAVEPTDANLTEEHLGTPGGATTWVITEVLDENGEPTGWRERSPAAVLAVEGSLAGSSYPLDNHQRDVAERVRHWAEVVGIGPELAEDLVVAAMHHDDGKADERFQRHLRMTLDEQGELGETADAGLLAKSALPARWWRRARRLAQVPDAWRHEAVSAERFDEAVADGVLTVHDEELVRHLILSHHGHFRGLGPWLDDGHPPAYQDPTHRKWASRAEAFSALNDKYGPYALALMESIVRLADWFESEAHA